MIQLYVQSIEKPMHLLKLVGCSITHTKFLPVKPHGKIFTANISYFGRILEIGIQRYASLFRGQGAPFEGAVSQCPPGSVPDL